MVLLLRLTQKRMATKDGFSVYDGEEWKVFGSEEGLPFGGVNSISIVEDEVLALGLGLEGIMFYDVLDSIAFVSLGESEGILSNKVKSVFFHSADSGADEEDVLWAASDNGIDRVFSDANGDVAIESYPSIFELPPPHEVNQLTDVKVDSKGIVWAGLWIEYLTNVGGISFYDGDTWTSLDVDDGLVGPVVYQLAIDSKDCVWVATSSGVSRYCAEPSSVKDVQLADVHLFPNPVHEQLEINLNQVTSEELQLSLYNSEMKEVMSGTIKQGSQWHTIRLAQLPSGMYFLKLGTELHKLV